MEAVVVEPVGEVGEMFDGVVESSDELCSSLRSFSSCSSCRLRDSGMYADWWYAVEELEVDVLDVGIVVVVVLLISEV